MRAASSVVVEAKEGRRGRKVVREVPLPVVVVAKEGEAGELWGRRKDGVGGFFQAIISPIRISSGRHPKVWETDKEH